MLAARGRWAGQGQAPIVRGWVIRVDVEHLPRPLGRVKKFLWPWWSGPPGTTPDLRLCWRAYFRPQQRRIPLPCAKLAQLGKLAERLGQDMDQAFTLLRATPGTATCACPTWLSPSSTAPAADFPGLTARAAPDRAKHATAPP